MHTLCEQMKFVTICICSLFYIAKLTIAQGQKAEMPDKFGLDFADVISDIVDELHQSSKHRLEVIKIACIFPTNEKALPIFSPEQVEHIKSSKTICDVFYHIRTHLTWNSHRLLNLIVKKSRSEKAKEMLKNFEKKINYKITLTDLCQKFKEQNMELPPNYCEMIGIVDKDYNEMTGEDYRIIDKFIAEDLGPYKLVKVEKSNSVAFVWLVPVYTAWALYKKASLIKKVLQAESFIFLKIGDFTVFDSRITKQVLHIYTAYTPANNYLCN